MPNAGQIYRCASCGVHPCICVNATVGDPAGTRYGAAELFALEDARELAMRLTQEDDQPRVVVDRGAGRDVRFMVFHEKVGRPLGYPIVAEAR